MVTNEDSSGYNAYTSLQLPSQERPLFYFRTLVCLSMPKIQSDMGTSTILVARDRLTKLKRQGGNHANQARKQDRSPACALCRLAPRRTKKQCQARCAGALLRTGLY